MYFWTKGSRQHVTLVPYFVSVLSSCMLCPTLCFCMCFYVWQWLWHCVLLSFVCLSRIGDGWRRSFASPKKLIVWRFIFNFYQNRPGVKNTSGYLCNSSYVSNACRCVRLILYYRHLTAVQRRQSYAQLRILTLHLIDVRRDSHVFKYHLLTMHF